MHFSIQKKLRDPISRVADKICFNLSSVLLSGLLNKAVFKSIFIETVALTADNALCLCYIVNYREICNVDVVGILEKPASSLELPPVVRRNFTV